MVARRPCGAIKSIVTNCTNKLKPFFLRLCTCDLPNRNIEEWKPILRKIDSRIQFKNAYAYNFDNSSFGVPQDIDEIIEMDTDMDME